MSSEQNDIDVLIDALGILARDVQTPDGVANACIAEAATRLMSMKYQIKQADADLAALRAEIERLRADEKAVATVTTAQTQQIAALREQLEAKDERIRELAAVVGKLPVDAENNPVVPHANILFYPRNGRVWPCAWDYRLSNGCWLAAFGCDEEGMVLVQMDRTYRNRESAALAAAEQGKEGI